MSIQRFPPVKFITTVFLAFLFAFTAGGGLPWFFSQPANAHSVAQVQTAKYFTPETVQMLKDRATSGGTPGLTAGDIVSYIVQFTPLANGATVGAGGYVTDYIPANTEVVGAAIVQPNGTGFTEVAPDLPGPMSNGFGTQLEHTFSNWSVTNSLCTDAGKTPSICTGSLAQVYADTGIFYSTDLRTKVDYRADIDGRVRQGTNGYKINPTAAVTQLNQYLNQTQATTHNQWDADQTNAFGTTALPTGSPISSQPMIIPAKGRGATPYNAGSAVAGPDAGYKLDNTGAVGPWQRIAYAGSRIGNPTGPALTATTSYLDPINSKTAVVGAYTNSGYNLSQSSPLPSGTNAVRWALGRLIVGQNKYVKISLRLTATPSATGLINNSEVFGGDSAEAAGKAGNDAVWRYHVPSVADNNSNLYLYKEVTHVCAGANCTPLPSTGVLIPANAKVRYRITYLNTGNSTQTNVVLSDTLPNQTPAGAVSNLTIVSGANILPISPTAPGAGATFTFATIPNLSPGIGGVVTFDVQTNATAGTTSTNVVINQAKLVSDQVPQITSNAVSSVIAIANLQISKTVTPASVQAGDVATYTLKIENTGNVAATNLRVYDFLPTNGGTTANDRFNFVVGSSIVNVVSGITSVVPATSAPPSLVPFSSQNRQQVLWNFGTTSSLAAGTSFTIQFQAQVGSNVPNLTTPYTNDARVVYSTAGADTEANASATAPVTVVKPADLGITKRHSPASPLAGSSVTYTIVAKNFSTTNTVTNAAVKDPVPTSITNVSWTCAATTPSSCTTPSGTGNSIDTTATLAPNGTATYTVLGTLATTATGVIPNTATVTAPVNIIDATQTNNQAIDNLTVASRTPNLVLVKRVTKIGSTSIATYVDDTTTTKAANDNNINWPLPLDPTSGVSTFLTGSLNTGKVTPNQELEYTIYFLSAGNVPIKTVNICDLIPTNTSYVNGSGSISFGTGAAVALTNEYIAAGAVSNTTVPGIGLCKSTTANPQTTASLLATDNPNGLVWTQVDKNRSPLSPNEYGYVRFRVLTNS